MKIAAHTLVKNEERFVWYSVMSVIHHVDQIFLWDTGSTDNTFAILKAIANLFPEKVNLRQIGAITPEEFPKIRQEMLEATKSEWFIVVDGDEIWWHESINTLVKTIRENKSKFDMIVTPSINLVGDIYHYQEEKAGRYNLAGRKGHLNLRAINRSIPGLNSFGTHGVWGWYDGKGRRIQERDRKKIKFVKAPYLHASFLDRSGSGKEKDVPKRKKKRKYEIGIEFPLDYYYPEVLFEKRPIIVQSVWKRMEADFFKRALVETPLRKIKRRIIPSKVGY